MSESLSSVMGDVPDHPARGGARGNPPLRIQLLAGFRVTVSGHVVPDSAWRTEKARHLVKLLALAPGYQLHREQVLDLLWPEFEPEAASNNLRVTLHAARRAMDPNQSIRSVAPMLQLQGAMLTLYPAGSLWVDVTAFDAAAAEARHGQDPGAYHAAIHLYTGDLLPENRYEDWAAGRREQLRATYLGLLAGLARLLEARGEAAQAIAVLERLAGEELTNEEAHAGLMRLYAHTGRRSMALRQYQRLREILRTELEVEPELDTQRLYAAILSGHLPSTEQPLSATPVSPAARHHNLPAPLTRFIGRERELTSIRELVAGTRLLTLTGTGGCGKTRLALALAHQLAEHADAYPDGIWLVELAPLADPRLVPGAIAQVLDIVEQPGRPLLDTLADALRDKQTLLLVDNCEHLIEGCAQVIVTLLAACPELHVLATSREALRVPGECTWRVPGLRVPEEAASPGRILNEEQVLSYEAVQLFIERARFVQPDFTLTTHNAAPVGQICRRLDGLPLAIELAAARVAVLSPGQIAARLDDALGLLAGGGRTLPDRQQTLRATLDWSYELLDEPERRLFERLAVFAGGWTLEAAEVVAAGDPVDASGILELLAHLVDKSLVVTRIGSDGDAGYGFLEPVRQYAQERLVARGEAQETRRRHAEWYLMLAEQAEVALKGPEQAEWLERLETEHDNLRAALAWTLDRDAEMASRLASAIWRFWYMHSHLREGRAWLERARSVSSALAPSMRARVLQAAGSLAWCQGDYDAAWALIEEALALFRRLDDKQAIVHTLNVLGTIRSNQGEYEQARPFHEESLRLARELGHKWSISLSLSNLAELAYNQGDYETAERYWEESLALDRELEDRWGTAITSNNLGELLRARGDLERAREHFNESLPLIKELGFKPGIAAALSSLAEIQLLLDDDDAAIRLLRESLSVSRELRHPGVTANALEITAALAAKRGQAERAGRLFGAAEALRASAGAALPPAERAKVAPWLEVARAQLPDTTWSVAWSEGQTMSIEQSCACAAEMIDEIVAEVRQTPSKSPPDGLTHREQEIALLVAAGLTNQQIAARTGISARTVDTHVSNVLRKLRLTSRSALRAWAIKHQLLPDVSSFGS